jgi:Kae1-associated kinase Bud32
MQTLARGAEAILYTDGEIVVKERLSKSYRIDDIDNRLRKFRTRREAKILATLQELDFPAPRCRHFSDRMMTITMDFISGKKVKDMLTPTTRNALGEEIGRLVAMLHSHDIIHGDLTTSNMIFNGNVQFIDFGLSFFSSKIENKAVDLFLLDRTLATTHSNVYPEIFETIITAYSQHYPEARHVLSRLEQVRQRGRNKRK